MVDIETILLRTMGYLRELHLIDNKIEDIRNEIIDSSGTSSGERVQSSTLGDQTFTKANRIIKATKQLTDRKELLNKRMDIIHKALADLNAEEFEVVNLMYFKGMTGVEVANKLNVSKTTIYRRSRSAKDKMMIDLKPLLEDSKVC